MSSLLPSIIVTTKPNKYNGSKSTNHNLQTFKRSIRVIDENEKCINIGRSLHVIETCSAVGNNRE